MVTEFEKHFLAANNMTEVLHFISRKYSENFIKINFSRLGNTPSKISPNINICNPKQACQ